MRRRPRSSLALGLLLAAAPIGLAACSRAPYVNVFGSYFPSWMLCVLAGIVATALAHGVLTSVRLDGVVPIPLVTYLAMVAAFSFLFWLVWLS